MTYQAAEIRSILEQYNLEPHEHAASKYASILSVNQADFAFTGERLVLNDTVRHEYAKVYAEHIGRYDLACHFARGQHILDAACGAGYGSKMLEQAGALSVTGVDLSVESISHAMRYFPSDALHFTVSNILQLPYLAGTFDIIVSFETIEHVPVGADWIRESARVLKDGGLFIVSTPHRTLHSPGIYFDDKPKHPFHTFEYTLSEFVGELLTEYNLLALYGQSFVNDYEWPPHHFLRHMLQMDPGHIPARSAPLGTHLIPLYSIKNAQPTFVTAICQKKG